MKLSEAQAAESFEQISTAGMEEELEDEQLLGESTLAKLAPKLEEVKSVDESVEDSEADAEEFDNEDESEDDADDDEIKIRNKDNDDDEEEEED